jgi:hypothetical protein
MPRDSVTIVGWWWKKPVEDSRHYRPADVLRLREMVARHCSAPHRFLCMTNAPEDLDGGIESAILPQQCIDWGYNYAKLFAFSEDMEEIAGPRALFLDLDIAIVGDIAPLVAGHEKFRILGLFRSPLEQMIYDGFRLSWRRRNIYNSSVIYMRTGALSFVWREFDLETARVIKRRSGLVGTDQAWIEYRLGRGMPVFGPRQGVFKLQRLTKAGQDLPPNARILFYPGDKEGRTMEEQYRHLVGTG